MKSLLIVSFTIFCVLSCTMVIVSYVPLILNINKRYSRFLTVLFVILIIGLTIFSWTSVITSL